MWKKKEKNEKKKNWDFFVKIIPHTPYKVQSGKNLF